MNINVYKAVIAALQAEGLEAIATIDLLLNSPSAIPDHTAVVEEIGKQVKKMTTAEAGITVLQQYFPVPRPDPAPSTDSEPRFQEGADDLGTE